MSIKRENLNISSGELYNKLAIYVRERVDKHFGPDYHSVFITNSENKRTRETAKKWAGNNCKLIERENTPIKNIRLLGLEYRDQGGRAYKCCDENNHVFDVKEDVILDILKTVGCQPGGILNGEFVWGREHNSSKLISVDSATYKQLASLTALRNKGKLSKQDIKKHHVYRTKKGEFILYLGEVYSNSFSFIGEHDMKINSIVMPFYNHPHNTNFNTLVEHMNKGTLTETNRSIQSFTFTPTSNTTKIPSSPYKEHVSRTKKYLVYQFDNQTECLSFDEKDFLNKFKNEKYKFSVKEDAYSFPYYKKSDILGFHLKDKLPEFFEEIADCSTSLDEEWVNSTVRNIGKDIYQSYIDFTTKKLGVKTSAFYSNLLERIKGESLSYSLIWLTVSSKKEEDNETLVWRDISKSRELYGQ
jgi:hypothetical protein